MTVRHEVIHPQIRTLRDYSDTITSGGTTQEVVAENGHRLGFLIQNISDTDMYVNIGADASAGAGSILVEANGGYWEMPIHGVFTGAVDVFCATTGKAFTAKEW